MEIIARVVARNARLNFMDVREVFTSSSREVIRLRLK
jgi:hypothetical protein